ncbi:MAG: amidohydrolase [Gracilibacteraceae bacterium]|jgi:5-methylthioadenosine/S-adenosylhomocysteine deaminase|nr:amidohydrolase [Gracilibacteraceae bacterium]
MLFAGIAVLDENFTVQTDQYVATEGKRIARIADAPPADRDYGRVYDGRDKLLLPAFYNAHTHLPMSLLRGYGENLPLDAWLHQRIFPFEARLKAEDIYWGTMLSIAEMLRFGVVSASDMYYSCDVMARAVLETGVKANLSRGVSCFEEKGFRELPSYHETLALQDEFDGAGDGRLLVDFALHAEYTNPERVIREFAEVLAERGARVQVHVSETKKEHEECKARHEGRTPVRYLADLGVFAKPAIAAHCVHLEGDDFALLRAKGVTVATCPKSNMKLASGVADVPRLLREGVKLALGTDGAASNNNLNMLEEIKFFALGQKCFQADPALITPGEALAAATVAGALAQGRTDTGLIREGYAADLVVLDLSAPYLQPPTDLPLHLLYAACGTDVRLTMADGRVLYENGEYLTLDLEKVTQAARAAQKRILAELAGRRSDRADS